LFSQIVQGEKVRSKPVPVALVMASGNNPLERPEDRDDVPDRNRHRLESFRFVELAVRPDAETRRLIESFVGGVSIAGRWVERPSGWGESELLRLVWVICGSVEKRGGS
jgi:hypothetical protein